MMGSLTNNTSSTVDVAVAAGACVCAGVDAAVVSSNDEQTVSTTTTTPTTVPLYTFNGAPLDAASVEYVDGHPIVFRRFVQQSLGLDVEHLFNVCNQQGPWIDPKHPVMGHRGDESNRVRFFLYLDDSSTGDAIPKYTYSGFQYGAMAHYERFSSVPELDAVRTQLERSLQYQSNAVRFNHLIGAKYRNGKDGTIWHSDKAKDITDGSVIALISLGATREFQLRNIATDEVTAFALNAGDLVLMDLETNIKYKHRLATAKEETIIPRIPGSIIGPRVSLVFRNVCSKVKRSDAENRGRKTEQNRENRKNRKRERQEVEEKGTAESKREKPSDNETLTSSATDKNRLIGQLQTLLDQLLEKK